MKHSDGTIKLANNIILIYAKKDPFENNYHLCANDVPDFDLCELACLMMQDDKMHAYESLCADNKEFESNMFPALLQYMGDVTNKDNAKKFAQAWQDGILNYMQDRIESLLNDQLEIYNINNGD